MKRKPAVLLFLAGFLFLSAPAQDKKVLRLDEAVNLSLTNSKLLKTQEARIAEAHATLQEAMDKQLPNASVSGSYLRLAGGSPKSGASSSGGGAPKVHEAAYGIMNLGLPVYNGGKLRYGIESSKYLEQAAKLDAETDKEEVIQNAIEAYSNLFKANSAVRLVKENLQTAQQREKDFANLEKNGLLARNDLLKAQLQTSNIELNLLDAQNNLQLAEVNMNLMLGLPANTSLVLDTTGIDRKQDPRVLDDYLQAAMNNRYDKQALQYRVKASETSVLSTKAEKLPSLQLTGGYIAADIPHVFSIVNAVNLGVGVSYNISSLWKNKAKVQQAEARVQQVKLNEAMLDDQITLQINKNYFTLQSFRKKVEVTARALEQAKENYKIVKNKFDNSLATTTELLEADAALLQSTLAFTLSQADAFVAYNKLLQSAGLLSAGQKK